MTAVEYRLKPNSIVFVLDRDTSHSTPAAIAPQTRQKREQMDHVIKQATEQVLTVQAGFLPSPIVLSDFDQTTHTVSYIVHDPTSTSAAIIDSVLDFDATCGRTSTQCANRLISKVGADKKVNWILETHAHADHLSAAPYLKQATGGRIGIGAAIVKVQEIFNTIFNWHEPFAAEGGDFDYLFDDGSTFQIGNLPAIALHVPGHTPADMAYLVGDAMFVGDVLFMPDCGTARADFPGGDAGMLFRSIQRLFLLPDSTRIFVCHDYKSPGRDGYAWETTLGAQKKENIHFQDQPSEAQFVAMRNRRDASLAMPKLLLPSIQVNLRGGRLPAPESNGRRYLKIPLDVL